MAGGQGRRPGDGDRRRYAAVLDAARAEGRIDDAELSRRSFTVRYAQTMGELDAVVDDLPGPAPGRRSPATVIVALAAIAAAVVLAIVAASSGDGDDGAPSGPAGVAGEGVLEPVSTDMFAPGMVERMLVDLAAQGVQSFKSITVYPEYALAETRVAPGALQYDVVRYDGAGLHPAEPGGVVSGDGAGEVFFTAAEFEPAVVASIAAQAGEVAGYADRGVSHLIIDRDSSYRVVTIRAYVEPDAYGSGPMLQWDGSGQHLLRDGRDQ